MRKILIIDDDVIFVKRIERYVDEYFPGLEVTSHTDPVQGLAAITTDLDLLLVDLEMPGIDGAKILAFAAGKGSAATGSSFSPPGRRTTCTGSFPWEAAWRYSTSSRPGSRRCWR